MQGSSIDEPKRQTRAVSVQPVYQTNTKDLGFLPIPKRLRFYPSKPIHFGLVLYLVFTLTMTFIIANIYYVQPLLLQLAHTFQVTDKRVSRIPTLVQAGYAIGLLFISPLGDLVRRRQLVLLLTTLSASLTIGLAVTSKIVVFETISFILGVVSVVPQILMPLAADIAPPERRATTISIVFSGVILGILLARVLSGTIAQFTSWRVVYYVATGIQYTMLAVCFMLLPDFPAKNRNLTYMKILWSMAKFAVTEPVLIQACLINFASMACYSAYWTTLTFLLSEAPYNYSTLIIGFFGLIGIVGVALGPSMGRVIDLLTPWHATLFCIFLVTCFQGLLVGAAGLHVVVVVIATIALDLFRQVLQVSLSMAIFSIAPEARARLNAVALLSAFLGQAVGTGADTTVFVTSGWRPAAALLLGLCGFQLLVQLIRGPHCQRYTWLGYEGGLRPVRRVVQDKDRSIPSSSKTDGSELEGGNNSEEKTEKSS